ncbi:Acyl-CoA dehydrogenase domain protein [Denitratisoma oestradiolicum]|uniref:Acyl-CoA dehydrogenase domain protein n=2 Tax=Denitratisoma oestradiolicum TaxID=311182 RepID=A0A6S6YAV9_9PROT|nr:Acyl-CoA dehydrogenase domain protein [Denitratisoma oestradiolicum]
MDTEGDAMDIDLDLTLTDEMLAIRESCHRFAEEVMRPLAAKLDRMDPEAVIAKDSPLWEGLEKYKALGLVGMPECYGDDLSPAQRTLMHSIVCEELAWGDVGLFITYALYNMAPGIAKAYGRPDLVEFFRQRNEICCLALTEPNHGSDMVAFPDASFRDPKGRSDLRARRDGDDFILNGQKAAWVSTGTIAGSGIVFATYENSKQGRADGAVFLMPFDLPGVSRGKPLDKLGQRTLNQGEIFFDNVRVPRQFFLMDGPDVYPHVLGATLRDANIAMGQQFIGVARAAYEHALAYAKERVQGGVPIIQHQAVKLRLFNMFSKLTAARSHVRRIAMANAAKEGGVPFPYAATAKIVSTQTCLDIAHEAITLFGGYGLCREYPVEKLFRDARASLIEDGENTMLALMSVSHF